MQVPFYMSTLFADALIMHGLFKRTAGLAIDYCQREGEKYRKIEEKEPYERGNRALSGKRNSMKATQKKRKEEQAGD